MSGPLKSMYGNSGLLGEGVPHKTLSGVNHQPENAHARLSDKDLWTAYQEGDETVFIAIYKSHFSALIQYGSQFTRNKELIKDCIQDLFLELSEKRKQINILRSIKFYLFKSLKHKIIAYLKKDFNVSHQDDLSHGFDFYFDFSIEHTMINRQLDDEKKDRLNRAVQKLSKRQREIIYYYYYEGLSLVEIKELMQLGQLKSAENLLYKTIGILRKQIPFSLLLLIIKLGL